MLCGKDCSQTQFQNHNLSTTRKLDHRTPTTSQKNALWEKRNPNQLELPRPPNDRLVRHIFKRATCMQLFVLQLHRDNCQQHRFLAIFCAIVYPILHQSYLASQICQPVHTIATQTFCLHTHIVLWEFHVIFRHQDCL